MRESGTSGAAALAALRLDLLERGRRPLEGLSVLAIGWGEGAICGEALRHGARRVVAIGRQPARLARAQARYPGVDFRPGSWEALPDERFDLVLLLDGLQEAPDPAALLAGLADRLAPGGTLVVEADVARRPGRVWLRVRSAKDAPARRFPSQALFQDTLAAGFASRCVGDAAGQPDRPLRRRVFHCVPKAGTVLLLAGPGRGGKSTLARELARGGAPVVQTDGLLGTLLHDPRHDGSGLARTVRGFASAPPHFGRIGDAVAVLRPGAFAAALAAEVPAGVPLVVVEGEILRHRSVLDPLSRALRARGLRPWLVTSQRPSALGAAGARLLAAARVAAAAAGRLRLPGTGPRAG